MNERPAADPVSAHPTTDPATDPATDPTGGPGSFSVQLDLRGRQVLVVGAGRVAARKVDGLLGAGAAVTVVAPDADPAIARGAARGALTWHDRPYAHGEVAGYRLAIAATGDPSVDGRVHRDGERHGIWVNAADDVEHCSFTLPAVARRGPISVAVSTDGRSPAVASWLRRRFERDLDDAVLELVDIAAATRAELKAKRHSSEHPGWAEALDLDLDGLVRRGRPEMATAILRTAVGLDESAT